jgi:hypothetical protein
MAQKMPEQTQSGFDTIGRRDEGEDDVRLYGACEEPPAEGHGNDKPRPQPDQQIVQTQTQTVTPAPPESSAALVHAQVAHGESLPGYRRGAIGGQREQPVKKQG